MVKTQVSMSLCVQDHLANLMFAWKYCLKDQFFMALNWLSDHDCIDDNLYQFWYNLGKNATWHKMR